VKIELKGDQLVISGERKLKKKEEQQKGGSYYERSYGSFVRSFTLPSEVKPEQIEADFRDGVLSIAVPKIEMGVTAKSVKIGEGKNGILSRLLGHKQEKAA
jgi:HSP20 family protein